MRSLSFTLFFIFLMQPLAVKADGSLPAQEAILQNLFQQISALNNDDENSAINDSISTIFEKTLHMEGSFDYPFDSLKFVGKIASADKKVKTLTWNIPKKDGTNAFFGFILYRNSKTVVVFKLQSSNNIDDKLTAGIENWPGCLIYEIIEKKTPGMTLYTYLGYRPESIFVTEKMIDVLWFENDRPVFGKPIFRMNKVLQNRIIFQYSAKARMSLTFNKGKDMIVFDHLSPMNPSMTGNYQSYAPDLSFDALKFEDGFWMLHENIDVRN